MSQARMMLPTAPIANTKRIPVYERTFIMFALAIYSGALTSTIRYMRGEDHQLPGEAEITNTISNFFILLVIFGYFMKNFRSITTNIKALAPYVVICGLCFASVIWSQYPLLTAKRCVTLASCILFGVYCNDRVGLSGLIKIYGTTTVYLCILSFFLYVAWPGVGHEIALGYDSAMRGAYAQKNTLGEAALLAVACYCWQLRKNGAALIRVAGCILLLLAAILLAKSATSLVIALLVLGFTVCQWFSGRRLAPVVYYGAFCLVLGIVFIVVVDPDLLFAAVSRDSSFSGRLPLWEMSLRAARQHFWLGYGYSAFWNADSVNTQYIWRLIGWNAPASHNGYIDIMLQIGIVGLAVYLWTWGRVFRQTFGLRRRMIAPETTWILMFMMINMLLNFDEGPLPYPDQFTAAMPAVLIYLANLSRRPAVIPIIHDHRPASLGAGLGLGATPAG